MNRILHRTVLCTAALAAVSGCAAHGGMAPSAAAKNAPMTEPTLFRLEGGPDTTSRTHSSGYVYVDVLPEVIVRVPPDSPVPPRPVGVEGTVMVQALVGVDGTVREVRVIKSIPMLDESAKASVMQWKFKPALSAGKPVAVWVEVPVKFSTN